MSLFLLAKSQYGVSDAKVWEVVFRQVANILLALDVEADSFFDEKGILHIVQVSVDGNGADAYLLYALESVR